ncbi:signal peptide peptidase SppA [Candidatus Cardinium hertigii]|uniref:Protease 4 n=1 Tax=Candidatus Cardinium hertigii TaxID=247481 RepID=A0A2Z3LDL0_9BACT|nr:signal peptide peptidase SppA [Candidatus Cardinium hertigii]AWN82192.1 Protease 4 [Candidatus Cardinium hertigii]
MSRFFKQVCTIAIGCFMALMGLCLLMVYVFSFAIGTDKKYAIKESSILTLSMQGKVIEINAPEDSLCSLFEVGKEKNRNIDLRKLKRSIQAATTDERIEAIFLKVSPLFNGGWAALEEIREALLSFKKAGKPIVAYGAPSYTNKSYYIASVADDIVLHPEGQVLFKGLAATVYFYTKLLQQLSIEPVIFRVGKCKSYVEPFCLNQMSAENRQQIEVYLSDIYNHFLGNISLARNIPVPKLKQLAHNLSAILPCDAQQAALVTKIDCEEGARELFQKQYVKTTNKKDINFIDYRNYLWDKRVAAKQDQAACKNRVAVIVAEGEIVDDRSSDPNYLGGDTFIRNIKAAQEDPTVKAVVLRINSPGGLAYVSESMWRAIEELKKTKKVVASLSDVAASGGYYMAAPCHYIFAHPTTLTGSIGIFALLFNPEPLMQKIGIEQDVVKTAPSADWGVSRIKCTLEETKLINRCLQEGYANFLYKVCKGRNMTLTQAEAVADGRVYTGKMAVANGLVDALGDLEAAVVKAAELAELTEKYETIYFPFPRSRWERLISYIDKGISGKEPMLTALQKEYPFLQQLARTRSQQGIQALLPYTVAIA